MARCTIWHLGAIVLTGSTNHPTAPKFMYIYHQKSISEGQQWFLHPMAPKLCIFYHQVSILDGPWEHHKPPQYTQTAAKNTPNRIFSTFLII